MLVSKLAVHQVTVATAVVVVATIHQHPKLRKYAISTTEANVHMVLIVNLTIGVGYVER